MACRTGGYAPKTFPVSFKGWHSPNLVTSAPDVSGKCQKLWPHFLPPATFAGVPPSVPVIFLVFPKGTDVRDALSAGFAADYVEVPAGGGVFYEILWIENMSGGFVNEALGAVAQRTFSNRGVPAALPTPYPKCST